MTGYDFAMQLLIQCAIGLTPTILVIMALKKNETVKHFKNHGLPVRWTDIILGRYHWSCGCGHPAYSTDYIGAGAIFELYTLQRGEHEEPPPCCHKCLKKNPAICTCGKVIFPGDEVAAVIMPLCINWPEAGIKLSLETQRILHKNCAAGAQIAYFGKFSPQPLGLTIENPVAPDMLPRTTHNEPSSAYLN
jgi:hypothetical protein